MSATSERHERLAPLLLRHYYKLSSGGEAVNNKNVMNDLIDGGKKVSDLYTLHEVKHSGQHFRSVAKSLGVTLLEALRQACGEGQPIPVKPAPHELSQTDQMRITQLQARVRELEQHATLFDALKEDLCASISAMPVVSPIVEKVKNTKSSPEEMGLMLSDMHLGAAVSPEGTGGLGIYNRDVFLGEMETLKSSISNIASKHLPTKPYPAFNVFGLGDYIENTILRPSQLRQTDMGAVSQVVFAAEHLSLFFAWLAALRDWRVNIYTVFGNHGRIAQKPDEQAPKESFEYLLFYIIKERLRDYPNISIHLPETWFMMVERMGSRFMLIHGEDFKAWMGIPFYAAQKARSDYKSMMEELAGERFDYLLIAHHHTLAQFKDIFINGSWPGGTEYSMKRIRAADAPGQWLFSINARRGITWSYPLQLISPDEKRKIKVYS